MTGFDEFVSLFGGVTLLQVIELLLAVTFLVLLYRKIRDFLVKKYEGEKRKEEDLKTALAAVKKYPEYRQQSIDIQKELKSEILSIKGMHEETAKRLEQMEENTRRMERNKLRDRLLQSYRYFTDKKRNPEQVWNRMEAEAFWELFGDYEENGGDGYVHTVVQPAMNLLKIIEMDELAYEGAPRHEERDE